jgi:hypothetical protein
MTFKVNSMVDEVEYDVVHLHLAFSKLRKSERKKIFKKTHG